MKKAMVSIFLVFTMAGFASAAGSAHSHTMTPQMQRQHNVMSVMQKQWLACKKSLDAEDFAAAGVSLADMQKAAANLAKFKLHKNSDMIENFKEQGDIFRKNLSELGKAVREKDRARTQRISTMIDNSCVQCHSVFR